MLPAQANLWDPQRAMRARLAIRSVERAKHRILLAIGKSKRIPRAYPDRLRRDETERDPIARAFATVSTFVGWGAPCGNALLVDVNNALTPWAASQVRKAEPSRYVW